MDGLDDLGAVDALQIDRRDAKVAVPEPALDNDQGYALVGHLNRVSMSKLVWGKPSAHAGSSGGTPELRARSSAGPRPSARAAVDDAEQRTGREYDPRGQPRLELVPTPVVHADFATSPALAVADEQRAAPAIEVRLVQGESFIDAKTRSPQDDDQPAKPPTVQAVARGPHDRDDLLDGRRVGRVAPPLVGRSMTGMKAGHRCRRPATARGINNDRLGHDLHDPDTTGGPTRVRSASHCPLPAAAGDSASAAER
jgi:hypothetical protein